MAAGMFLVPIYSRLFTRADYGVIETFNMLINITMLVLPCGLFESLYRFVYESDDRDHRISIYSTTFNFLILLSIVFFSLAFVFRFGITNLLIRDEQYVKLYVLTVLTIILSLFNGYNLEIFRSQFQKYRYLFTSVGTALLLISGGIYFVVFKNEGVSGFFYASVIAQGGFSIVGYVVNRHWLRIRFSKDMLVSMLKYGLPFIPAGLTLVLMKYFDRMIVQRMLGLEDLGLYSMGIKISSMYDIVGIAFSMAWFPYAMKIIQTEDAQDVFKKMFLKVLVIFGILAGLFCSLSQYLLHILADKKFWDAGGVISLFVLSSTIINLNYVLGLGIFISKKTKYIFIPTMVGGLVNVALCYLLTGPMGIIGAALSSFVGSIVYLVSSYVISQKLYHIEYEIKRGLVVTSVAMAWAGAIYYLEQYTTVSFYEIILVKSALLMLVLSMVFASKLVSINQVRSLLART